ncbi:MAG: TetR/AcrR family transcriptional regulator [Tepidisphaeraceae bacterium]
MPSGTRETLISTAARLFHEQGFSGTGVATILREANVNSGSLYHYFPSKEALVVGVLEWYRANLRPIVMDPVEKQTADPIDRVFSLLSWYRSLLEITHCKLGCPIGNLALELADNHPDVRRLTDENFVNWTLAVRQWLDDAGDQLPASVDRLELSQMVLNTMEGGIMQARARADLAPFDAAVRQLRKYFDYLERDARASRSVNASNDPEGDRQ